MKKLWTEELINEVGQLYQETGNYQMTIKEFHKRYPNGPKDIIHGINLGSYRKTVKWDKVKLEQLLDIFQKYNKDITKVTSIFNKVNNCNYSSSTLLNKIYNAGYGPNFKFTEEHVTFIKQSRDMNLKDATKKFNEKFKTSLTTRKISAARSRLKVTPFYDTRIKEYQARDGVWYVRIPVSILSKSLYMKLIKFNINNLAKNMDRVYKIALRRAVYNWITAGNDLLDGYVLLHIDGNSENDNINNLRAVTLSEQFKVCNCFSKIGGLKNVPTELADTLLAVAQLDTLVKEKKLNESKIITS